MKRMIMLLLMAFTMPLCAFVEAGEPRTPAITCRRAAQAPVIDGYLNEDAWRAGGALTNFFRFNTDEQAGCPSAAILLYDDKALYLGVLMRKNIGQKMSGALWSGDCVEFFIDPGLSRANCFQLAGTMEQTFSAAYQGGGSDFNWKSGMNVAAKKLTAGWALEMSIPFSSLGKVPSPGDVWGANVCRDDPQDGLMTLAPLKGAFCRPQSFCEMTFADKPFDSAQGRPGALLSLAGGQSAARFQNILAERRKDLSAMPDGNPAKPLLKAKLDKITGISDSVEHDAREHPVFADIYREWTYAVMRRTLEDEVHWRLMIAQLLFDGK